MRALKIETRKTLRDFRIILPSKNYRVNYLFGDYSIWLILKYTLALSFSFFNKE